MIQTAFDISKPILGTLIWACPNLISSKTETITKPNSSFLIKSAMKCEHNNEKIKNKSKVVCLDSLMIKLGHRLAILSAKMLIWAPFSQSMCTFSFYINPTGLSIEYAIQS